MRELLRTNDPILLSFVASLLKEAGLTFHVADAHMSIVEGSIGILPRRILILDEQETSARCLLRDARLAAELANDAPQSTAAGAFGWRPRLDQA